MYDPIAEKLTTLSVLRGTGDMALEPAASAAAAQSDAVQAEAVRVSRLAWLKYLFIALGACILFLLTLMYQPAVEVSLDGELLGIVSSTTEFEAAMDRVESRVSDLVGYEYTLPYEVSYHRTVAQRRAVTPAVSFESQLLEQADGVVRGYILTINGVPMGAARDRDVLEALLLEQKAVYESADTVAVEYTQDVTLTNCYLPVEALQNVRTIRENLTENLTLLVTKQVVYEVPVAYQVEYVEDDSMFLGHTELLQAGSDGVEQVVTVNRYQDNAMVESSIVAETMAVEPVNEVIAVGTATVPSTGALRWPLDGPISSPYGYRDIFGGTSFHSGIDIASKTGVEFCAADSGVVTFAGYQGSYGNFIIVDHGGGLSTCYAHCSAMLVNVGDIVTKGQVIGQVGTTGRATGPHLHFEVRVDNTPTDPMSFLP